MVALSLRRSLVWLPSPRKDRGRGALQPCSMRCQQQNPDGGKPTDGMTWLSQQEEPKGKKEMRGTLLIKRGIKDASRRSKDWAGVHAWGAHLAGKTSKTDNGVTAPKSAQG